MEETSEASKVNPINSSRLIVTKLPAEVYAINEAKTLFEQLFRSIDANCEFIYLPSFRRALVNMSSVENAIIARNETQGWRLPSALLTHSTRSESEHEDTGIRTYFADGQVERRRRQHRQMTSSTNSSSFEEERLTDEDGDGSTDDLLDNDDITVTEGADNFEYLAPPKPEKMFLLSPPASPPVGWEPRPEAEPLINYDLLHAIASLEPGKSHELHPPESDKPSIVVTPCEGELNKPKGLPDIKIPHTACPKRS